mmetsp:Transcript_148471/g.476863  ORF Transcript_148471/g.476863 Transcript_148471/m.476863 type:complete len:120 (+) Transcript_148471:1-360(+)
MQCQEAGKLRRPNASVLLEELDRLHGRRFRSECEPVLVVASQPHIPSFEAVVQSSWLGRQMEVEVAGPGICASSDFMGIPGCACLLRSPYEGWRCNHLSMALDAIATWLHHMLTHWSHF